VRVLLVEDSRDDALAVEESLRNDSSLFRFHVTHATSLDETRQRLETGGYHVVLCDLGLPDTTGLDTLASVRGLVPGVPVLVVTGRDDEQLAIEAMRRGADDFLVKGRTDIYALGRIVGQSIERHRLRAALDRARRSERYLATHDTLTRLANRKVFIERLNQAIAATRQEHERMFALLFIDLDRFKPVNDLLGHSFGDRLLRVLGERLRGSIRQSDTAARLGGDEFVVLLRKLEEPASAVAAAEHILAQLTRPVALDGQRLQPGLSLGIAVYPLHAADGRQLLQAADRAMYAAKSRGGGIAMFAATVETNVSEASLARDFGAALLSDRLALHYQPLVDVSSGAIIGAEALVRWNHPQAGTILPKTILPLAAQTGHRAALDEWVLRSACRQIRLWSDGRVPIPIAVNMSAQQVLDPGFPAHLGEIMRDARIEPRFLISEIPETGFRERLDAAGRVLAELADLGVRIAVDDFGTGHSSLGWLRNLPIGLLKIDRSFIAGMTTNPRDEAIVGALTSMGRALGMEVVAEGVETAVERDLLTALDCRWMQGFLFGPPMPVEAIDRLLSTSGRAAAAGGRRRRASSRAPERRDAAAAAERRPRADDSE